MLELNSLTFFENILMNICILNIALVYLLRIVYFLYHKFKKD